MISQIKDFEILWMQEFDKTQKVFKHIPDRALGSSRRQCRTKPGAVGLAYYDRRFRR